MEATVTKSSMKDLMQEQAWLRAQVDRQKYSAQEPFGYGYDLTDFATYTEEQARNAALHRHFNQLLDRVEHALVRFFSGSYGLCEVCGQQIDTARLAALPYSTLCVQCQQRREYRRRRKGGDQE